jgi:hypothetical protein
MTTPVITTVETDVPYAPNNAQLERAAALRRFNWLYIYTPIIVAALICIVLIGLLFWGAFSPNITGTRNFASALADIVIILTTLPLLLLCAIGPVGALALFVYRRQKRVDSPAPGYGRLHILLWRLDTLVSKGQVMIETALPKVAQPVIQANARAVYWRTLIKNWREIFNRSRK